MKKPILGCFLWLQPNLMVNGSTPVFFNHATSQVSLSPSNLSLSLFIYIYIYMYTVFIYTHRKRCKKQDLFVWFDNGSSLKVLFFTSFTKNLRRFRPWTVIWRIIIERIPSCRWLVCEWDGEIPGVTGEAFLRWNLSLISNK